MHAHIQIHPHLRASFIRACVVIIIFHSGVCVCTGYPPVLQIQGIKEGGEMALTSFLDRYVSRVITLANSPGDADDFIEILWG